MVANGLNRFAALTFVCVHDPLPAVLVVEPARRQTRCVTRVVLCLDKLKGSLTATDACAALAAGITAAAPDWDVRQRPVADGGEGTVDALVAAGWSRVSARVAGPLGDPVEADLAVRGSTAVVEMAQASGLALLGDQTDALGAGTLGTGQLVLTALDLGCTEVVLAVGGSASTDGGAGMLQALGARLSTSSGGELEPGGGALTRLTAVDLTGLDPRLANTRVVLASDVENPLLGPDGAAAVYGPQKGATPAQVSALEVGLRRLAELLPEGLHHAARPGAGAAGGTGWGALAVLGAQRTSGADLVLAETALTDDVAGADLVVVGEGRLDGQSLAGKAPVRVADLARRLGVPVVAVAGQVAVDASALRSAGIDRAHQLLDHAPDHDAAVRDAAALMELVGALLVVELRQRP